MFVNSQLIVSGPKYFSSKLKQLDCFKQQDSCVQNVISSYVQAFKGALSQMSNFFQKLF